jgi:hypothetical protein
VSGPADGAAVTHWLTIHDQLLRGVTHALSNRVAAASVSASVLALGAPAEVAAGVRAEVDGLEALLRLLRQLPRRDGAPPEPVLPGDVVRSALALFAHHPEWHEVPCRVALDASAEPAWGDPDALCHALLVALAGAGAAAAGGSPLGARAIAVTVDGDEAAVRFTVAAAGGAADADGTGGDAARADVAAIAWLLAAHGGEAVALPHGCVITVPSLRSVRATR